MSLASLINQSVSECLRPPLRRAGRLGLEGRVVETNEPNATGPRGIVRYCHQCGKPLPATARRHARFCSPAHRAAYHRSSIAAGMARVRFPVAPTRDKAAPPAYIAIVADNRFPGMYRLKRSDGSPSDMVNLTRARDALAEVRGQP